MELSRRGLIGATAAAATLPAAPARAQRPKIRIGVLTDLSGPYRDTTGITSVACTNQALVDFGVSGKGLDVEVISADHQNKPDVGATIARQWFDTEGVDVVARQKDKIHLNASATSVALTGEQCSPNTIVWSFDTYMLAKSSGGAMVKAGGDSWFIITANYAFGHSLEELTAGFVTRAGGTVKGTVRYPFPDTSDFSSYITQAMASGAKVIGLANAGNDTVNSIKQAHEFGAMQRGIRIAPLLMFITDVHALGLETCAGLTLTESFYWDLNPGTRAFTERVRPKVPNNWPSQAHASSYASTLHYLKAVAEMGVAEAKKSGRATVQRMKQMPTEDDAFGRGRIREDGRGVFPAHLFQVKTAAESKGPWDVYKLLSTTPAEEAVRPLAEGKCVLLKT